MAWQTYEIGKWRGSKKSLPQIILTDPDWFFWACEEGPLKTNARAQKLYERARAIKVPQRFPGKTAVAEYFIHPPTGKFAGVQLVPSDRPAHEGSSATWRRAVLDLRAARDIKGYDKTGGAILVSAVKAIIFPGKARVTRNMCESFFDDDANFDI